MPQKDVDRLANSVDPDQSSLIRIYTVCSDIYVPIFRIFTVSCVSTYLCMLILLIFRALLKVKKHFSIAPVLFFIFFDQKFIKLSE